MEEGGQSGRAAAVCTRALSSRPAGRSRLTACSLEAAALLAFRSAVASEAATPLLVLYSPPWFALRPLCCHLLPVLRFYGCGAVLGSRSLGAPFCLCSFPRLLLQCRPFAPPPLEWAPGVPAFPVWFPLCGSHCWGQGAGQMGVLRSACVGQGPPCPSSCILWGQPGRCLWAPLVLEFWFCLSRYTVGCARKVWLLPCTPREGGPCSAF